MTITEFLTARYDEEEAVVREVQAEIRRQLDAGQYLPGHGPDPDEMGIYHGDGPMDHPSVIVGPATVLADIAAKRAIVGLHPLREITSPTTALSILGGHGGKVYLRRDTCGDPWMTGQVEPVDWPCPTLLALAQPFAEHPDFDPEWRV